MSVEHPTKTVAINPLASIEAIADQLRHPIHVRPEPLDHRSHSRGETNWIRFSATRLAPAYQRALIRLSIEGRLSRVSRGFGKRGDPPAIIIRAETALGLEKRGLVALCFPSAGAALRLTDRGALYANELRRKV